MNITISWLLSISLFTTSAWAQGVKPAEPLDLASYFPLRQGDTWTYDWQYRIGKAPQQTVKRTRAFEGREFVDSGFAHKLASENGDYTLFSLNENGLFLHGAAEYERDARFLFDPPLAVLTKEMKPGQPVTTTQLEEDGKTPRRFTSLWEGVVAIETPMGRFSDCLKVSWEMDASLARQKTTYFLAKNVGIVAYQIEVKAKQPGGFEMSVDARLRLAQLHGQSLAKVEELKAASPTALAPAAVTENSKARAQLRKALESGYTWDKKFPGFTADFTLARAGAAPVSGSARLNRQLQVEVTCPDAAARAFVHAELSQFVSYRQARPFDESHSAEKTRIGFGNAATAELAEIIVSSDESPAASYHVREREITRITQSYGRVRFVINHLKSLKTDDGHSLPTEAELTYYSNETGAIVSRTNYTDRYEKIGSYWLPVARKKVESVKDKSTTHELSFANIRYLK